MISARRALLPFTPASGEWPPAEVWVVSGVSRAGQEADPCLSAQEQARAAHFHRPGDRARFVSCRGALRRLLANRRGCLPQHSQLTMEPLGGQCCAGPVANLWFKGDHSADAGVVAVADEPVGYDVELIDARHVSESAAAPFFTDRKLAELCFLDRPGLANFSPLAGYAAAIAVSGGRW